MATIKNIKIKIVSFTDGGYPGWILCSFQDIEGKTHFFEEKIPVVGADDLTEKGIETHEGQSIFQVSSSQISDT